MDFIFKVIQNRLNDPKENKNIICTMVNFLMKYIPYTFTGSSLPRLIGTQIPVGLILWERLSFGDVEVHF